MDFERWVASKLESLKMKTMAENSRMPIPQKILDKVSKCDPNDRNTHGETIMISVVRYINDEMRQVKYLQVLLRADADPNLGDTRHGKTPLMFACQEKKKAVCRLLISHPSVNLDIKDHQGNTAATYANINGDPFILSILMSAIADVHVPKKDIESTDVKNVSKDEKQVQLLQTMHQQLALMRSNDNIKDLSDFRAYKTGKLWLQKSLSSSSFVSSTNQPLIPSNGNQTTNSVKSNSAAKPQVRAIEN